MFHFSAAPPIKPDAAPVARSGTCVVGHNTATNTLSTLTRPITDLQPNYQGPGNYHANDADCTIVLEGRTSRIENAVLKDSCSDEGLPRLNKGQGTRIKACLESVKPQKASLLTEKDSEQISRSVGGKKEHLEEYFRSMYDKMKSSAEELKDHLFN
ncbi:hypothetical protein RhiXN_06140 [Rhizoctonia solani]|uniref:Uncharacterized protein n=1 Tax=Rhizoctonia solani TaxID=456999 RepID=A0A8H8NW24_9AGAM|nr:uncharacterized protein RhiXN_06140 [Rhizoctonia solani]QRW21151.1 hypothetical protein RhiXN_06140 [Rhizoctonia solani]